MSRILRVESYQLDWLERPDGGGQSGIPQRRISVDSGPGPNVTPGYYIVELSESQLNLLQQRWPVRS